MSAKSRWAELLSRKQGALDRGRRCAELTIPSILPPEGADDNTELPTPYQSLGARGVNNLSSKLLLALFPPGQSFVRLRVDDTVKSEIERQQWLESAERSLVTLENRLMRRMEAGNRRAVLHAALKHLIVVGNALIHLLPDGSARMFRLDQYCVLRSPTGQVIEIVIKELVNPATLTPEVRDACGVTDDDKNLELYTWIRLQNNRHVWHQEINDIEVPGSSGSANADETPWLALRWQGGLHEDYGRGLVEEYLGDLISAEGASKSIIGFAAIAAKVLILLDPNSTLTEDDLQNADIGDILVGKRDDVHAFTLEKFNDFRVAKETLDEITLRLSHAFLLQSGTIRDAERVTAEEIRAMAQELEDVLGGTYTVMSQELQLPIVKRDMAVLRDRGEFPAFPRVRGKPIVEPMIITGFDALGRGHELNRFRAFASDAAALLGEEFAIRLDARKLINTLAAYHNVNIEDFLLDENTVAQRRSEMQRAQMAQTLVDKATGPVAGAVAKNIGGNQQ